MPSTLTSTDPQSAPTPRVTDAAPTRLFAHHHHHHHHSPALPGFLFAASGCDTPTRVCWSTPTHERVAPAVCRVAAPHGTPARAAGVVAGVAVGADEGSLIALSYACWPGWGRRIARARETERATGARGAALETAAAWTRWTARRHTRRRRRVYSCPPAAPPGPGTRLGGWARPTAWTSQRLQRRRMCSPTATRSPTLTRSTPTMSTRRPRPLGRRGASGWTTPAPVPAPEGLGQDREGRGRAQARGERAREGGRVQVHAGQGRAQEAVPFASSSCGEAVNQLCSSCSGGWAGVSWSSRKRRGGAGSACRRPCRRR